MSNQIAVHTDNNFKIATLDEAMRYAQAVAGAGIVPDAFRQQPANILVAQEIAKALGESVWVTMSEMSIISGKPSFSAKFMRSRVRQAGHKLRESFDTTTGTAKAVIIRSDDPDFEHTATWNQAKAEQHGLWGKGHWRKNPELMLKNRALSEVVREACYEVMGGIAYTPDEVQDFAPMRATAERVQPQQPTQATAAQHIKDTLGGEPIQADTPQDVLDQIAQATTPDELTAIYEAHKAQPYLDQLRPHLTERKNQLTEPQAEQPTLDVEAEDVA